MAAPRCPECGGKVAYDLTCHTWPQQQRDGGSERFMTCMPCDSAIEYLCTEWLRDDKPGECNWRYTHGLNPRNPRSAANDAKRPAWIPVDLTCRRDGFTQAVPGVRMLGDDDERGD
jgi:hypothetical protein